MKREKKSIVMLMIFVLVMSVISIPSLPVKAAADIQLSGTAHVQTYGDKKGTYQSGILTLGTTGEAKRLESITINFNNNTGYEGTIQYRVHRQTYGWTDWVSAGSPAGTTGESKRLEGIQLRLTGELAKKYSIKYRVHIQTYGWNQGWQYDGALAGTEGEAKRLESLEIQLVPKTEAMGVTYRVHRQTYGWEMPYLSNGQISGTTGQAKRLEGIEIALTGNKYSGNVVYSTHVQSYGWMSEVSNGMMSGTTGQAKRLESIKIRLEGEIADYYDIYYRVHAQSFGWMGWVKNGAPAGTSGYGYRLEAIQITLVKKGGAAPTASYNGATQDSSDGYSDKEQSTSPEPSTTKKWHEAKYQTVKIIKCLDCKRVFKNEKDIKNHFIEYTDDNCDGDYTSTEEKYLIQDGYYEYNEPGKTYVPIEYKMQWITDEEEYIEKDVPVYEMREFAMCLQCKERFYGEDGNVSSRLTEHLKNRKDCWSYTVTSELEQVGTRDVVHPELGHWAKVLVKHGYNK